MKQYNTEIFWPTLEIFTNIFYPSNIKLFTTTDFCDFLIVIFRMIISSYSDVFADQLRADVVVQHDGVVDGILRNVLAVRLLQRRQRRLHRHLSSGNAKQDRRSDRKVFPVIGFCKKVIFDLNENKKINSDILKRQIASNRFLRKCLF